MKNKVFQENSPSTLDTFRNKRTGHESQKAIQQLRGKHNSFGIRTIPPQSTLGKRKREIINESQSNDGLNLILQAIEEEEEEDQEPPTKKQKISSSNLSSRNNKKNKNKTNKKVSWAPNVKTTDGIPGAYIHFLRNQRKKQQKLLLKVNNLFVGLHAFVFEFS